MAFDPITAALQLGKSILDRTIPDKAAREQAKAALAQMQVKGELQQLIGQLEINKAEAQSSNWFVAGWRPAIGWICGAGLASQFLVRPFATWIGNIIVATHPAILETTPAVSSLISYPSLDLGTLMTLLLGMLGLATHRTYEKIKGAQGNH
jgi:hypothetical protein